MGTLLQNTAEGGTNGTALTSGNSGGASGTAFSFLTGTNTVVFSNVSPMHGSLCYTIDATTDTSSRIAGFAFATPSDQVAIRFYIRLNSAISATGYSVMQLRSASALAAGLSIKNNSDLYLSDTASQISANGFIPTQGTWYRLEFVINRATGAFTYNMYVGDSTTPFKTTTGTGNFGAEPLSEIRLFKTNATSSGSISIDSIAIEDGRTTEIGPYVAIVPLTVSVGADQAIKGDEVASITATPSGGTGSNTYTWSKVSGPTGGSFSSTSTSSTTFKPDAVGTYTLKCVVSDGTSSVNDTLDVVVTARTLADSAAFTTLDTTGWTLTLGTAANAVAALSDALDTSYLTSGDNPASLILKGAVGISKPDPGQDLTVTVRAKRNNGTSGSITAKLLDGTSVISTKTINAIGTTFADYTVVFPSTDVANVAADSWGFDVKVQLEATAA